MLAVASSTDFLRSHPLPYTTRYLLVEIEQCAAEAVSQKVVDLDLELTEGEEKITRHICFFARTAGFVVGSRG
jgi:hypothetical protein